MQKLTPPQKEVLYLRYKLQRGLLNKDQPPKEDEMKQMSEYLTMLENVGEQLEVAIIRATRINKVLKQILKLSAIPREAEFNFKSRSQKILDKWNQVLSTAEPADKEGAAKEGANGVNGDGKKSTPEAGDKAEAKDEAKKEDTPAETKAEDEPAKKEVR